jgi:hypothetical protein
MYYRNYWNDHEVYAVEFGHRNGGQCSLPALKKEHPRIANDKTAFFGVRFCELDLKRDLLVSVKRS